MGLDTRMLLDRACDIIERGSGARRGRDEVQVVQKGSEVFPHLKAALRRRSTELVLYGISPFAAVVLRDFVAPAICVPPKVGGGAAVPRAHIRDVVWSDLTQLRQEGCTGHRVIGAPAVERDDYSISIQLARCAQQRSIAAKQSVPARA